MITADFVRCSTPQKSRDLRIARDVPMILTFWRPSYASITGTRFLEGRSKWRSKCGCRKSPLSAILPVIFRPDNYRYTLKSLF
ncbi:hypothetical protein L596_025440 [Steinernema carpocapsae]|uniref:Uncharacterized protein n=1 Tax=Steinernema carpocapsae TaxID=34508 RepID=A0A4V5ZYV8_STECR|nr:hypothetical protein L596_025440 [Steinernema carpocapsae]